MYLSVFLTDMNKQKVEQSYETYISSHFNPCLFDEWSGVSFVNSRCLCSSPTDEKSEQDSFLKNIRAKKRNNDLQKARQTKGKSYQKIGNKFRLRGVNA